MDYKKKYLKYKLKYLTAKKLYGGMNAETLKTRVKNILNKLPTEYVAKWENRTIGEWNDSAALIKMIEGYSQAGYDKDITNDDEQAIKTTFDNDEDYYDKDMINKIPINLVQDELERVLKFWEDQFLEEESDSQWHLVEGAVRGKKYKKNNKT